MLHFQLVARTQGQKSLYNVVHKSNSIPIGVIRWYMPAKEYRFETIDGRNKLNAAMLREIADFLSERN